MAAPLFPPHPSWNGPPSKKGLFNAPFHTDPTGASEAQRPGRCAQEAAPGWPAPARAHAEPWAKGTGGLQTFENAAFQNKGTGRWVPALAPSLPLHCQWGLGHPWRLPGTGRGEESPFSPWETLPPPLAAFSPGVPYPSLILILPAESPPGHRGEHPACTLRAVGAVMGAAPHPWHLLPGHLGLPPHPPQSR